MLNRCLEDSGQCRARMENLLIDAYEQYYEA